MQELPFMATEKILMACVEKGKSRQEMHEVIKKHSVAAGLVVKEEGKDNDLLKRLAKDPTIPYELPELEKLLGNPNEFTGRAEQQTEEYLTETVGPILERHRNLLGNVDSSLSV